MTTKQQEIVDHIPDRSWLHGKYGKFPEGPDEYNNEYKYEVHTLLPYISIGSFFVQGEEADKIIDEIHQIWVNPGDLSVEEAIQKWESIYL
jgi:hypothetical protein